MHIIPIIIYCLMAVLILFGVTFHDELLAEQRRKQNLRNGLILIDGGKAKSRKRAS